MTCPHLAAVGAVWVHGADVGGWIAERLGPFGPSVGHAVPLHYPAYAIVPIPWDEEAEDDDAAMTTLDALLGLLEPYTGQGPVYSGIWDGFPITYPTGTDPRDAVHVDLFWAEGERPSDQELARSRAEAIEQVAADLVESPDTRPLELPNRRYHVWRGPLRSALALRHHQYAPPSLIWPHDRAWFVGAPIYTDEFAVAGSAALVDAILADERVHARRATPDDILQGDD
ncbi:MAG TPA: hypothetical protein VNS09_17735 [Solirubrobacter sp.]|nr:hypothetical protein [Solirubrobacter sp.]